MSVDPGGFAGLPNVSGPPALADSSGGGGERAPRIPPFVGSIPEGYAVKPPAKPVDPSRPTFFGGDPTGPPSSSFVGSPRFPVFREGAENDLANTSVENLARIQAGMVQAGLIGPKTKFTLGVADNVTTSAYHELLAVSNRYADADPFTTLDRLKSNGGAAGAGRPENPVRTSTSTSTSTSSSVTDPTTAKVVLRRTLEQELGRAPREDEVRSFVAALNGAENASPAVSTTATTSTSNQDTNTSTSTSTSTSRPSSAPSAEVAADEFARSGKAGAERNTFRAATDYYDQAMSVLGAGGGGVRF